MQQKDLPSRSAGEAEGWRECAQVIFLEDTLGGSDTMLGSCVAVLALPQVYLWGGEASLSCVRA